MVQFVLSTIHTVLNASSNIPGVSTEDALGKLLPNVYLFLTHLFAFSALLMCVIWLIWKPTQKSVEARQKYIADLVAEAEEARKEAFEKLNEADQIKFAAHSQAKNIVDKAINQAYIQKEQIEGESKINAKKIIDDAQHQAERMQYKIKLDNEKEIIEIALSATESLLQKKVTKEENEELVKNIINKMNNNDRK